MLLEMWQRLRLHYNPKQFYRSRRGFQLLPSTVSEYEFSNLSIKPKNKRLPRFYSQNDGFEENVNCSEVVGFTR